MGPDYVNQRPLGRDDYLLIMTTMGAGKISTPEGSLTLQPGQAILYHPGAHQDYRTEVGAKRWVLHWAHFHIREGWQPLLNWPAIFPGVGFLDLHQHRLQRTIEAAMHDLTHWHTIHEAIAKELAVNALHRLLLLCASMSHAQPKAHREDARISKVTHHIMKSLGAEHSIEQLARVASLSPSRLSHLFKEVMGCTPLQYTENERMRRARNLLCYTSLRIGEIATEVGFENAYYFSTRFKHQHGVSPRAYRIAETL